MMAYPVESKKRTAVDVANILEHNAALNDSVFKWHDFALAHAPTMTSLVGSVSHQTVKVRDAVILMGNIIQAGQPILERFEI